MWFFNLLATFQRELLMACAAGVLLGVAMQLAWSTFTSGMRDPVSKRLVEEMNDPATFVRMGMAFGLFLGGHLVVEAIAHRRAPLTSEEGLLIYLLFLFGAFSLAMGLRATMLRLTRRLIDAEKGKSQS